MPAWVYAVLAVIALLAVVRYVVYRHKKKLDRIRESLTSPILPPYVVRREKLYDR